MIAPAATPDIPLNALSEPLLTRLALILEEMVEGYQRLLSLLQEEKSLIVEANNEALIRCVGQKEDCLSHLAVLEKGRQKIMLSIAPERPSLSLKILIPHLPLEHQDRLIHSHVRLEALTASIQEINQINGLLINRVLGQITGLMTLLQQMTTSATTYQASGMMHDRPLHGRTIGRG